MRFPVNIFSGESRETRGSPLSSRYVELVRLLASKLRPDSIGNRAPMVFARAEEFISTEQNLRQVGSSISTFARAKQQFRREVCDARYAPTRRRVASRRVNLAREFNRTRTVPPGVFVAPLFSPAALSNEPETIIRGLE